VSGELTSRRVATGEEGKPYITVITTRAGRQFEVPPKWHSARLTEDGGVEWRAPGIDWTRAEEIQTGDSE
jgi:hypothetical protein